MKCGRLSLDELEMWPEQIYQEGSRLPLPRAQLETLIHEVLSHLAIGWFHFFPSDVEVFHRGRIC